VFSACDFVEVCPLKCSETDKANGVSPRDCRESDDCGDHGGGERVGCMRLTGFHVKAIIEDL
jgi:hypothetical protein